VNENFPVERRIMPDNEIAEITKWMMELAEPGSKTALRAAGSRFEESQRPEGVRICYDPYALHFISKNVLEWAARNPEKMKVIKELSERSLPGFSNSIIARVRYFDDFVKKSMDEDLEQLVILGAGYDTRAYQVNHERSPQRTQSSQRVPIVVLCFLCGVLYSSPLWQNSKRLFNNHLKLTPSKKS
jgi:hypothetical protein